MKMIVMVLVGAAILQCSLLCAQKKVMVPVPCTKKDASGNCVTWGGYISGCKAPAGGSCTAVIKDFPYGNLYPDYPVKTDTCTATNGQSCNARIPLIGEGYEKIGKK